MKKELQRNVNGMTSGGGSIQHPFSIHSASFGSRWKLHGLSLMMTILLLFTMGIGQMWGTEAVFTGPTDLSGSWVKGKSFTITTTTNGVIADNTVYYSTSEGKVDNNRINPYRVGFVFKPQVNCTLTITAKASSTGKSCTHLIYEVNDSLYNLYKDAAGKYMTAYILSNYSEDENQIALWKAVSVIKNNPPIANGDSAKVLCGTTVKTRVHTLKVTSKSQSISNSADQVYKLVDGEENDIILEAGKKYLMFTNTGSTGVALKSLTFTQVASSGPSVSGFNPASGAEVGASQEITINGSTGSTIYYLWATSAPANAAAVVSADHHGTAGAASATTTVESGKTLYAVAVKDETNSAVASASYTIDDTAPTFSSSTPANSATDVAASGTIVLTFSEEIANVDGSKFTLTGATKGTVAIDGTDATKVNVPYSGAGSEATVTLSVTAGAVSDAAGNALAAALSDISFTTAGATPCPTSGVVYTMTMKSKSLSGVTQYSEVALAAGDYATETGGVSYLGNNNSTSSKAQIKTEAGGIVYFDGNDAYLKVALDCPLQPGDLITIEGNASSTELKYLITNTNSRSSSVMSTNTTGTKKYYTVVADDILDGNSNVYFWREGSSGNKNIHSITITRPYTISFASAKGSAPSATTGFEVELAQITGVAGWVHTGWTADKVVKVSEADVAIGTAMAVDATATVSANTTFTAVWEEEVPTFSVTYKANNGTEEADVVHATESTFAANMFTAPTGKMFNGWNTSATGEGASYAVGAAVPAATTVFAQWIVDPTIRLILQSGETYSINTEKFEVYTGTELDGTAYTVQGTAFAKNFKFGNTGSAIAGQAWANKFMAYDVTTNSTDIKLYLYNKNSGTKNLYYQIIYEGAAAGELQTVEVTSKGSGQILNIPTISATKGARIVFYVNSTDVRICQMEVRENGTALPAFGAAGYEFSIPGRAATYNNNGTFDGFTIKSYSEVKFISGISYLALRGIDASSYVTFTTASNIQLQVTTANANKFYVCAANIGTSSDKQYGGEAGTHNVNLLAGTYYIVPTAGSSGGEVQITKLAFATAPDVVTVTFKDGASTLGTQDLFSGEKATALDPAPTKSSYRLVGWSENASAEPVVLYDFDDEVTADLALEAVWQKTWTVTFDSDGGSDVAAATVDDGATVAAPDPAPTKGGYDFVEWQLSGSAYDFSAAVTADIELVATWEVAQDDASLSALSYNGNAIDVNSAVDVSGVQTYTVHLPWGSSINAALISVTKNAESASLSSIVYNSENKQATFQVESGNHSVVVNYAIQFVIDPKRGTSIIKATTNNVVTGLIGGTIDQSYSGNANSRKLNKGNYFGVTLANDEIFQEGDVFIVNITTPADLGKFMVFADKDRNELIADQGIVYTKPDVASPVVCPTGEMMLVLPAAANGKKSLYLSRENVDNSEQWNVTFSYIEVTREMNPAIKSFKFGDDAATINESAKTITYEVAYGTAVTALTPTVEAYGNNGATYTPAGATDFTSPVVYTVTDAYNELHTDYTVTVNIAAPSTNAYLASLSVAGYALDFDKEVETYNIVLDYGTTVLPTITYEVEDVGLAEAVKVEDGVNGATTITVTPQAGVGYEKVYTINFSVSTTPKFVIYDGQKSAPMSAIATSGSDVSTGFAWTITGASNTDASNGELSFEDKTYSKYVNLFTSATKAPGAGDTRYITITIPDGYLAKFRVVGCGNGDGSRSSYISKEITGTLDQSIAYATSTANNVLDGRSSALQLPGTYYYCADNSIRLYELSVQLYPIDYSRDVTEGRYGTICLSNGGVLLGADLYEVAYYGETSKKIFFDEILSGVMEAGVPYVFLPQEGVNKLAVVYTDDADAAATSRNGLVGFIGIDEDDETSVPAGMYILQNNQYREVQAGADARIKSYRAYINLTAITPKAPALSPGRRRVSMSVVRTTPTGMDELNASEAPRKVMINGTLFILRGEKMYDATGRLVK